jgi:hypothetical protein
MPLWMWFTPVILTIAVGIALWNSLGSNWNSYFGTAAVPEGAGLVSFHRLDASSIQVIDGDTIRFAGT